MHTLRVGSTGEDVEKWQYFLRGIDLYLGEVDGVFSEQTKEATQEFQRRHALTDDGIAGNRTIGEAMRVGFSVVGEDPDAPDTLEWPPQPAISSLGQAGREAKFGSFSYQSAPTASNPEAIRITSDWAQKNIIGVTIPQLSGIKGAPSSGKVEFHKLVGERVAELFRRWEDEGLLGLVLTYGGSFVPRFIRGSRTILSPHAHGSAFDINVAWNGFGAVPARVGATGSVRRLVPSANQLGFVWGGHFKKRDGMHFELVRVDS